MAGLMNPTTSLSMTYLRAYAQYAVTQRGMVRASRKAMHMLRMHWSVCATDARKGPSDRRERINAPISWSPEGPGTRQTVSAQGGQP
jgi:hypothetical protein